MVKKTIAVLTGGGDCPGLNAVIRAVARTAWANGYDIYGIRNGFKGLVENDMRLLSYGDLSGILVRGGTILGTTNRDNPFRFVVGKDEAGKTVFADKSLVAAGNLQRRGIDCLVVIGGDGSLHIAEEMHSTHGINVVGVPKTIDNDLPCTERTFGFDTAVAVATEALDRLHTTADSHHRIMVLEVMGRYAGWIALHAGIAGGADVILLPEIPYKLEPVVAKVRQRQARGKLFDIVVVAEGAKPLGGELSVARIVEDSFEKVRLGGAGAKVADALERLTGVEARSTQLGYIQRGGTPTAYDRILSTRYGVAAVEAIRDGNFNTMVSLHADKIVTVPIEELGQSQRLVPVDSDLIAAARQIGVCFGD